MRPEPCFRNVAERSGPDVGISGPDIGRGEVSSMRIHVYAICWNEIRVIDFFLRHYESLAERIVVYDEDSDDGTRDVLAAHQKVDLRRFTRSVPDSLELSKLALFDQCWKEARGTADWVIVVDCDEHVFHPRLADYLEQQKGSGVTFVPTLGFQMVADQFPEQGEFLARTRTMGAASYGYSKPCVFDPDAIAETNFEIGLHGARPTGRMVFPPRDEVMLLHYKFLGLEYVTQRYSDLGSRRGTVDQQNEWDAHFGLPLDHWRSRMAFFSGPQVNVAADGFSPSAAHAPPSWRTSQPGAGPGEFVIRGIGHAS